MHQRIPWLVVAPEVAKAQQVDLPVLALESAVITHGLPYPDNLELARSLETEARAAGATPATIAVLDGKVHVGLADEALVRLASQPVERKISRRDFGIALAMGQSGGTTVAGTLAAADLAGIRVFATGGIGGVHRDSPRDVSADLPELAQRPVVVVCAGAKAILDLAATVEMLETLGVPVVGYRTDEFPAFYARRSGLPVDVTVETPEEIARIARRHWGMGFKSAVLVVQPPPEEESLPGSEIETIIQQALADARDQGIRGAAVTPFLLARVKELSGGESLRVNLALLRSNARLGAQIAVHLTQRKRRMV